MLQYCGYCQHSLGLLQCGRRPQVLAASDLFTVDACAVSIGQAAVALSVANQQADLCRIRSRRVIASSDGCRLQWPAERTTVSPALGYGVIIITNRARSRCTTGRSLAAMAARRSWLRTGCVDCSPNPKVSCYLWHSLSARVPRVATSQPVTAAEVTPYNCRLNPVPYCAVGLW